VSLDSIAQVNISVSSAGITRAGFGVPLVAVYHDRWGTVSGERWRVYTSTAGMLADGFLTTDPAYQMATAIFSQQPRVPRLMVGRRALAPTQTIDLTPSTPALGVVYTITVNGEEATYTAVGSDLAVTCTAIAAALTAENGLDVDAILATGGASTAGIQTLTTTSLNGVLGQTTLSPPRAISLTFDSHADWDATNATITGTNAAGAAQTETLAIPNGGAATVNGTKLFKTVTSIGIPAQTGTGGTFTAGVVARFAATGASGTKVVVTSTTAGTLQALEDATATLTVKDATSDPGVATDLAAIAAADNTWYGLVLDSNSEAEINAAAEWAEANEKLFVAQTADTAAMDSGSTTDVAADLQAEAYGRTTAWYHPAIAAEWLAAGLLGNRLVDRAGTDSWAYKTIRGVSVYTLTETQKTSLHAKNVGTYTTIAGVNVTEGGKVAGGEWVDVVRGTDALRADLRERVFALKVGNKRVPFTTAGIELIGGAIRASLASFTGDEELLSPDTPPVVQVPLIGDVSAEDKAARTLPGVEFSATLTGAIHFTEITGSITP